MSPIRSSRGRPVGRLVAVAAVAALGVAGCGVTQSGSDISSVAVEAGRFEGPGAATYLGEVAEATGAIKTQRMSTEMVMEEMPMMGDLEFTSESRFDNETGRGQLTMDMSALFDSLGGEAGLPAGAGVMEMVVDGDIVYVKSSLFSKMGGSDKPWLRADASDLAESGAMTGGAQSNPQALLEFLRSAGSVEELGTESVRGVQTTHLSAVLELEDFIAQAPEAERGDLEDALESLGTEGVAFPAIPAEVWVDGDGYVRRYEMTLDFSELAESGDTGDATELGLGDVSMTITVELYDFDQPVDITIPDPSEVGELDTSVLGGN